MDSLRMNRRKSPRNPSDLLTLFFKRTCSCINSAQRFVAIIKLGFQPMDLSLFLGQSLGAGSSRSNAVSQFSKKVFCHWSNNAVFHRWSRQVDFSSATTELLAR